MSIPGFDDTLRGQRPPVAPAIGAGSAPGVTAAGIVKPSTDFNAVRDGRRSTLLSYAVDLSTARSIAAGTALPLAIEGNIFHSDPLIDLTGVSQSGIARVHFQDQNLNPEGTRVTVLPSAIYRVPFTQVLIENYAQAGKFLYIIYGVDVDLQPGASQQVQATILNNPLNVDQLLTLAGTPRGDDAILSSANAFHSNGGQTAVAAQFSYCQWKNPAASGKTLFVDKIIYYSGLAADFGVLMLYNTDLATDLAPIVNRYSGQAAGSSHVRSATSATAGGPDGSALIVEQRGAVSGQVCEYTFPRGGYRLDAGKGIAVRSGAVNESINATMYGREY